MKIAIRADGGANIGMGHIMRTLVLAKELSKIHDVFYVCRLDNPLSEKYRIGIEKVKSEGFEVREIREDFALLDLKDIEAELLITDSYDVDEKYFDETKQMFNKTAYIDDMNLHYFNVDFLINQNIDGGDFDYKVNTDTKLIIGSDYIMLREEFSSISEKYIKEEVKDIMITVGGSDPHHITEQILDYVKKLEYNFHIVVGPSFEKNNYLKGFENSKVILYYNASMYEIMQNCDIAISACGSTLYELAVCGVPTLGLIIVDNQQGIAKKMDELSMIKNMGWYDNLFKGKFVDDLNYLCRDFVKRGEMSLKSKKAVDGHGVKRIVKELGLDFDMDRQ
ncbi:UDP-2,4-diacetamido-2,4,6-trideoxy-beta-L-altropyranose hydrolase [Clostridium tagluense]|uniref:UDP-2,4-diacetamido-2,4, 6-trideoxy-beta-L-altropyranose hydrolase n=1 Tax=Clostridium tagluense TaxID=360422 RepID=UPI001CF177FE|nr:UDP-2,4-diacetamido-2,4,6-trideoxy-beta-L-altropyranose hydrolase [Clostridium tagluense]MCB2310025.1 UDP-2,4-diacetamido-2,4,6-trideoxy-beta-L-altropyranose hydrolase [Clostridium tagluense]MCB2314445.1 UDP-2,4-diacetamido-2,4,6-trideoxy-beta-L-altropyranose hydrolase [Clostridium tagluense]MCB2319291.1 UDP-2,4-diacetamido-2,4,6-trideoxy-beta-L-altropyranose hydrolase [Clostridium tagluense]MCB2324619.1 UDP-2,4-diacetamido-2,4,6-trideoxy-beta-L-altropyranose hydrolase [Clostridium tagluense